MNFFAQFSDAHCHLPRADAQAFPQALSAGTLPAQTRVLLNCAHAADFERVAALAAQFPAQIVPAFGVHPWFADEWNARVAENLRRFLAETPRACVGEIGLDRAHRGAPAIEIQENAFCAQLALAAEFGVPASIHCVRAFGKTEAILREFFRRKSLPPILLHAYCGSAEQAKIFAQFGAAFSAPRRALPPQCVVVPETDAPIF